MKIVAVEEDELGVILTREEAEIIAAFLFTIIAGEETPERKLCRYISETLMRVAGISPIAFEFKKIHNHLIALTIHKC